LKALILAGGFGTRLRPLSCTRPKILFPIVNKPMLQWTLESLRKSGINEAILAVSRQTELAIKQYRISRHGLKTVYSRDPLRKPLGSGGPVKKAEKLLDHDSPFLVMNGDIFTNLEHSELIKRHDEKRAIATIALTRVKDPSRYGVTELAADGHITKFVEKPPKEKTPSNLINAGVYVLSPRIFDYIPAGKAVSLEREVFTKLAEEKKLYGYVFDGLWFDIGKPEDYLQINRTLLNTFATQQKLKEWKNVEIRKDVAIDKRVTIGEKTLIGPYTILGRSVAIGKEVSIQESIVFPETRIADHSAIRGAIIGENVEIGKNVKIRNGCILADHVKVRDNVTLGENVSICPAKEIAKSVLAPANIC